MLAICVGEKIWHVNKGHVIRKVLIKYAQSIIIKKSLL